MDLELLLLLFNSAVETSMFGVSGKSMSTLDIGALPVLMGLLKLEEEDEGIDKDIVAEERAQIIT